MKAVIRNINIKSLSVLVTMFLLAFVAVELKGQDTLTLDECINTALEKNLTVLNAELATEISKKEYHRSLAQALPVISAYAQEYYNSGRTFSNETGTIVDNQFWSGGAGILGSMQLFNKFQNIYNIKQNKAGVKASQEALMVARNELIASVIRGYYQIIITGELIQQYKEQVTRTTNLLRKTEIMVEEGQHRQTELYRVKAQYEREKMLFLQAENNNVLARNTLAILMHTENLSGRIFTDTTIINPDIFVEEFDSLQSRIINNSPLLKNRLYLKQLSEYQLKLSRKAFLPSLSLNANITNSYTSIAANPENNSLDYPFNDQLKNNLFTQVYVTLQIPIFSGMQLKYNNNISKIRYLQAANNYETAKMEVQYETQQLYLSAKAAYQNYIAAQQLVKANELTYLFTEKSFELGTTNIIELTTAGNDLMDAKASCTNAKIQYIISCKLLELNASGEY